MKVKKIFNGVPGWHGMIYLLAPLFMFQCGCASTKVCRRSDGKRLNHVEKPSDLSFSVDVILYGATGRLIYANAAQSAIPSQPLSAFEVKKHAEASAENEFHYGEGDDVVYVVNMSEKLIAALKRNGIPVRRKNPDYYIKATFERSFGKGLAGAVVWDVIVAVPSVFLPVPILCPYNLTIDVTLYDSQLNLIENRKVDAKARGIPYSVWSRGKFVRSVEKADADSTVSLILEMIQENGQQ